MANYGGLSYGNQAFCGTAIDSHKNNSGQITGMTCFQIYNNSGTNVTRTINGSDVIVPANGHLDIIITTIGLVTTQDCLICSCHDCANPDGNFPRAISWPMTGATGAAGAPTLLNPSSPYTLIGMGYLNS